MNWQGVIPAITTPFKPDLSVDADLLVKQVDALVRAGCTGIVALGSLGEGGSLSFDEKKAVLRLCKEALAGRASLVAGVAALTTADACRLAELGAEQGASGLMVLPPYVYKGDWRETRAHFEAAIAETSLPCMLYNNPIAYGTDVLPEQVLELASSLPNLVAVKESSADVRRVTALRAVAGDRLSVLVGVDDLIVEGVAAGAVGWIAGLADALPAESVRLFDLAIQGKAAEARALYEWFLPLLRLDVAPKFVQLIKLVQAETGLGSETVRPPRLALAGAEREAAVALVREALARRSVPA
jgi:4-hydroxy-tetrahydrodipicolinate synthase